jgi:outer membrane immunogenic protein
MRLNLKLALLFACFAASPALAADLPPPVLPPPPAYLPAPAPVFNWTGFYIGGNVGWGWTYTNLTDVGPGFPGPGVPATTQVFPLGTQNNLSQNGFLGGGQIGFNYQINRFVVGVEGDFDATAIKHSESAGGFGGGTYTDPWTSTLTARVGYALDRALIYGKGGGAWMQEKYNLTAPDGSAATGTFNRWGWTAGIGFEYAVLRNLTVKAEYDYMNFGTQNQLLTPNALDLTTGNVTGDTNSSKLSASVVKVGVNWLFH